MKQQAVVAIATFADTEEDSLASGASLVRRYLDVAFGDKSKELIPGGCLFIMIYAMAAAAEQSTAPTCHMNPNVSFQSVLEHSSLLAQTTALRRGTPTTWT